tara:strand:+ start:291 stop:518 length:228 start_codon:yes stop_codon:yes gene_type:complete
LWFIELIVALLSPIDSAADSTIDQNIFKIKCFSSKDDDQIKCRSTKKIDLGQAGRGRREADWIRDRVKTVKEFVR